MSTTLLHYLYWFLVFFGKAIQLLGLSSSIYKVGLPLIAISLFVDVLIKNKQFGIKIIYPYFGNVLAFIIIAFLSKIISNMSSFSFIYFLIYTLLSYLYFLVVINDNNQERLKKISKFIIYMFLIQILGVIIKLFIIGPSEAKGFGTLAMGSNSTTIPMFATVILFSLYIFNSQKKYLFLILMFVLFGISGGKRAIVLFIPLIIVIVFLLKISLSKLKITIKNIKNVVFVIFLCIVIFYILARVTPSLNPEKKLWGRFDLKYTITYIDKYSFDKRKGHSEISRIEGLVHFTKYVLNKDTSHFLLGDGAGKLVQSKYRQRSGQMLDEYGVRYGGRMGFIWLLLQVGFLGVLIYLFLIFRMYLFVRKNYRPHPLYLAFLVLTFVFLIDTFIYSNTFLINEFLKGVYFFIFGLIYQDVRNKRTLLKKINLLL